VRVCKGQRIATGPRVGGRRIGSMTALVVSMPPSHREGRAGVGRTILQVVRPRPVPSGVGDRLPECAESAKEDDLVLGTGGLMFAHKAGGCGGGSCGEGRGGWTGPHPLVQGAGMGGPGALQPTMQMAKCACACTCTWAQASGECPVLSGRGKSINSLALQAREQRMMVLMVLMVVTVLMMLMMRGGGMKGLGALEEGKGEDGRWR
jgi:hypothetical protein